MKHLRKFNEASEETVTFKNTDEDILVLEEVLHPNICNSRQNLKTRQFSNFPPKFVNTVHAAFYLPPFSQGAGD